MTQSIHFGKPLAGAPKSFEDTLHKLAEGGISSTFRCYFPQELVFEASVQGQYSGWVEDAASCKVLVVGFQASYVTLKKSGHSLSFEPRYAIVKKMGRGAKNHYLALYGPYAQNAKIVLATQKDHLARVIETSPFQEHIERKQRALAQVLAKHYQGDIGKTPISLDAEFTRNKFMEDAFRAVRLQRLDAREAAQQKVLEAASIHFTHFHGDLNAKFDGLVGAPGEGRRNAKAKDTSQTERKALLREMVQAWGDRLESQLRTLAKF